MSLCYVYGPLEDNLDTAGIAGALLPTSCTFDEEAGGSAELTLEHPYDKHGKWRALVVGNIVKASVPVRSTPEIENGAVVTSVEIYTVKADATTPKAQRYLYKKSTGSGKKKLLSGGMQVVVVSKPVSGRWKVKTSRYGVGWMEPDGIELEISETIPDTVDGIEQVAPSWSVRPQLFEIQKVEQTDEGVIVSALHISYQLLKNITSYATTGAATLQQALDGILGGCVAEHDFRAYTDIADTRTGLQWELENPIKAMLDPEDGAIARWGCQLVRDDYEMFFLRRAGRNRGLRIEYGKNLAGVRCSVDMSNLATRIVPTGETKDGKTLYLDGSMYVDSPNLSNYARPHVYVLKCEDCKVGTDGVTETIARARMREQAQALLDGGCDAPEISLSVEYAEIGASEEYKQYRQLERLFLYDEVLVAHHRIGVSATLEVVRMSWDCVHDRAESIELGTLKTTAAKLASWQIPSGISGGKLLAGSVGSGQMGDDIISARHLQAESVNTEALQAEAVTAEKVKAGSLDAMIISAVTGTFNDIATGRLTASEAYIAFAEMMALAVGQITAGTITTDQLAAALGSFVALWGDTAGFDFASIRDMVTDEAIIRAGTAGELYIDRLAATSAVMVSATLGELIVKGADGAYYQITVQADGTLGTSAVSVSADEAAAGQTTTGKKIVETEMDVAALSAQTVKAANAQIGTILTSALTAGKITAGEALIASATIPTLYVTAVEAIGNSMTFSANATIRLLLGAVDTVNRWFTFDNERGLVIQKPAWTDADGVEHAASIWYTVTDEVGYHIRRTDMAGPVGSFARDRLIVDGVQVGGIVCRKTSGGAWVWTDA